MKACIGFDSWKQFQRMAPVVQGLDSVYSLDKINHFPLGQNYQNRLTFPVASGLSSW